MKIIRLHLNFSDELGLKSIIFQYNDTGISSDRELLKSIANGIIQNIEIDNSGYSVVEPMDKVLEMIQDF